MVEYSHEALDSWGVKTLKYYLGISVSVVNPNPKEVRLPMEKGGIVCII
jgi:hypothetical protein